MKLLSITIFVLFYMVSIALPQTQFGESGLYYTPSAYSALPGVYEFGIFVHRQFYKNNIESPSPLFLTMGLAPGVESFASFPDIFSFGNANNLHQQYGNIGLKVNLVTYKKKHMQLAITSFCKYFVHNKVANNPTYLPGCTLHLSWISAHSIIYHVALGGNKEVSKKINLKINAGIELFLFKDYFIFYIDSYISPLNKIREDKEWMGIISVLQWFPHYNIHIETGTGLEIINNRVLPFIHLGFSFSSGPKIKFKLRKKKDELPEPPPLEDLIQSTSTDKKRENGIPKEIPKQE